MLAKSLKFASAAAFGIGLCFGGCDFGDDPLPGPPTGRVRQAVGVALPGFVESVVFSGLQNPTVVRFASDGRVFVAEKRGRILVFDGLNDSNGPDVFANLEDNVHDFGDRGLLGMALDPGFPAQPYVYVLYAYDAPIGGSPPTWGDACPSPPGANQDGCVVSGRLSRLTAAGGGNSWTGSEQVMINAWGQQYPSHSIGDLEFDSAGNLYASGGDGASYDWVDYGQEGNPVNPLGDPPVPVGGAQTPPSAMGGSLRSQSLLRPSGPVLLSGTVIRVDKATGNGLPQNPYYSHPDPNAKRIVASGLRNPFRMAHRPSTNEIFVGDVGWGGYEEVNRIRDPSSGANFGWPCYEGSGMQDIYSATNLDLCNELYANPGAHTAPVFDYLHGHPAFPADSCLLGAGDSVSGLAFYEGGAYPDDLDGALFVADYSRKCISVLKMREDGQPDLATAQNLIVGAASPVFLEIGPEGDLFYCDISDGTVRRVQYLTPVAVASAKKSAGQVPFRAEFDGSASVRPFAGEALTFAWDLDGDGAFDDGTGPQATYTYQKAGKYAVRLQVVDPRGASDVSEPLSIRATSGPVTDDAPAPVIDSPAAETTWDVGDEISFSGHATDTEDGNLSASALRWDLFIQHCIEDGCHAHPLQSFVGVSTGTFATIDHEYPMYLELVLTATDSDGNQSKTTRRLDPNTFSVVLDSNPVGLMLGLGSKLELSPFARRVVSGSNNAISAAPVQSLDGLTYAFEAWSDGLAATHNMKPVKAPARVTATYRVAGLIGEYFDDTNLSEHVVTRIDPVVDFEYMAGEAPDPSIEDDSFSTRWTGSVVPEFSETYQFCAVSDEGARLWVGDVEGAPLLDNWDSRGPSTNCAAIELGGASKVPIRLEHFQDGGSAAIRLFWSSPSRVEEVVPATRLYPSCDASNACPSGLDCSNGHCVLPCDTGDCKAGQHCVGAECDSICADLTCPTGDVCESGLCVAESGDTGAATGAGGAPLDSDGGVSPGTGAGGTSGVPGAGATGGATGVNAAGRPKADGGDGCGCRVPGKPERRPLWPVVAVSLLFGWRRRNARSIQSRKAS